MIFQFWCCPSFWDCYQVFKYNHWQMPTAGKAASIIKAVPQGRHSSPPHPSSRQGHIQCLGRDFPLLGDQQLSKIQSAILAASGQIIGLWLDPSNEGFSEKLMPVKTVIETGQQTLALIGNASCYINESRWNSNCQQDQTQASSPLFCKMFAREIWESHLVNSLGQWQRITSQKKHRPWRLLMSLCTVLIHWTKVSPTH